MEGGNIAEVTETPKKDLFMVVGHVPLHTTSGM